MKHLFAVLGTLSALGSVVPANALTFNLNNIGGAGVGTNVYAGFSAAAGFWSSVLKDNVVVDIDIGFAPLSPGVLGSTGSNLVGVSTALVLNQLRGDGTSALDAKAIANLPVLTGAGGIKVITSGYANAVTKVGVTASTRLYDTDDSANNISLAITSANAKALGFTGTTGADASITFSSNFAFDFDPADGIGTGSYDFIGIATHEIGHALGFISGVDTYDYYAGPYGPARGTSYNLNNYSIASTLDLFRYTRDPFNLVPGTTPTLDWSIGGSPYFSVDAGVTAVSLGTGAGTFSTGAYNGNKRQASHWVDNRYTSANGCQTPTLSRGIFDPTAGACEALAVTSLDLAALDAIGWDLSVSTRDKARISITTKQIATQSFAFAAVPEPGSWAMLIAGFGLTGATLRQRRAATRAFKPSQN